MEEINGVTFKDYACASANIVAGMSVKKVCEVLGLEIPVWEATQEGWNNKMSEMTDEQMAFYSQVFTNPKQGKFESVEGSATGPEEVLKKYPDWSDTIKMEIYMSEASSVGIDPNFEKEFDISLTEYSQLAMHWSNWFREKTDVQPQNSQEIINDFPFTEEQNEASRVLNLHEQLRKKWEAHYKKEFAEHNSGIADDIDF